MLQAAWDGRHHRDLCEACVHQPDVPSGDTASQRACPLHQAHWTVEYAVNDSVVGGGGASGAPLAGLRFVANRSLRVPCTRLMFGSEKTGFLTARWMSIEKLSDDTYALTYGGCDQRLSPIFEGWREEFGRSYPAIDVEYSSRRWIAGEWTATPETGHHGAVYVDVSHAEMRFKSPTADGVAAVVSFFLPRIAHSVQCTAAECGTARCAVVQAGRSSVQGIQAVPICPPGRGPVCRSPTGDTTGVLEYQVPAVV